MRNICLRSRKFRVGDTRLWQSELFQDTWRLRLLRNSVCTFVCLLPRSYSGVRWKISMAKTLSQPIFSDEVAKVTALNYKSGAILSRAVHHPIVSVRNDECFTLMRREDIARIVTEAAQTRNMFKILNAAFLLSHDETLGSDNIYSWLRVFDREELQELVSEVSGYTAVQRSPLMAGKI